MRKRITVDVSDTDRETLTAIVTDRNSPQKHVWRAQIVLLTADGCGTVELTRRTGTSKSSVWRWQERFMAEGVPGLLRDKTRPSRIPPLGTEIEARVVAATQTAAPGVAMARHIGISVSSVQRIWRKHGLQPAPGKPVQAVQRSKVCSQAARYCGTLSRSAGACRCPVDRREEPNSGA